MFDDPTLAKVFDRALQLDLDRQVWEDAQLAVADADMTPQQGECQVSSAIRSVRLDGVGVPGCRREFSWERLRFMARRIAAGDESSPAYEHAERFLDSVPDSLKSLYDLVPKSRIDEFKSEVTDTVATGLREYLS